MMEIILKGNNEAVTGGEFRFEGFSDEEILGAMVSSALYLIKTAAKRGDIDKKMIIGAIIHDMFPNGLDDDGDDYDETNKDGD